MPRRPTTHRRRRFPVRRLYRPSFRTCWTAPDDLHTALVAFRRAIRCHRRLARLAPRFFDSVVVTNDRLRNEQDRQWMAVWEPILARVYGTAPEPFDLSANLPTLPHPNTQRAVERQLTELEFWLAAGQTALDLYRHRRPHALMSLTNMAGLMRIALDFKQLAGGIDPDRPPPEPHDAAGFLADLQRAYPDDPPSVPDPAAGVPLTGNAQP